MAALRSNVILSLGLITVPVAVHAAVDDGKDTSLNTLCNNGHDPVKVKAPLHCPQCDNRDRNSFVKGRDLGDGTFAIVDTEAIAEPSDSEKNTMPLTTHPAEDVDHATLPGGKVYFLAAAKGGGPSYPLMVELVKRRPEVAFCTMWAPRSRIAMYRLGALGDALTLTELAWPESVRDAPTCDTEVDERMIPLAEQFIEQLLEPFDPERYKDRRTETLREFIAQAEAVAAGEIAAPTARPTTDLLAALQAAVEPKKKRKRAPAKRKAS